MIEDEGFSFISGTLYADYISEREGFEIIENGNSFIIYKIKGDAAFISHGFTSKPFRQKGNMSFLLDELSGDLRSRNVSFLSATIDLRDLGASNTLLAALKYGFKVKAAEQGILYIEIELGEK